MKRTLEMLVDPKKNGYVYLGEVLEYNCRHKEDEETYTFLIEVYDIRVWEVALGTGKFYQIDQEYIFGHQRLSPRLTLRYHVQTEGLHTTSLIEDVLPTSGLDWKSMVLGNKIIEMEFSRILK